VAEVARCASEWEGGLLGVARSIKVYKGVDSQDGTTIGQSSSAHPHLTRSTAATTSYDNTATQPQRQRQIHQSLVVASVGPFSLLSSVLTSFLSAYPFIPSTSGLLS